MKNRERNSVAGQKQEKIKLKDVSQAAKNI